MASIAHILNLENLNQVQDQLIRWGYQLRPSAGLVLVQTTDAVSEHTYGGYDLKGLVYEKDTGVIVAPGCIVPLEAPPSDLLVKGYTYAHDGILFRFYHYDGTWYTSTTGRIIPNVGWGARGCRTFESLLSDATDQLDQDMLDQSICYYAILEHVDFTNVIKHTETKLTLVKMVDIATNMTFYPGSPDSPSCAFKHQEPMYERLDSANTKVGLNIHYTDGSMVRSELEEFKRAEEIKPNLPDVRQHWVILNKIDPDMPGQYLEYYPWESETFQEMSTMYQSLKRCLYDDYQGLKSSRLAVSDVPPRHIKYMRELLRSDLPDDATLALEDIGTHLRSQDWQRIYYMLDPDNVSIRKDLETSGTNVGR